MAPTRTTHGEASPCYSNQLSLEILVEGGCPAVEVIQLVASNNAEILGVEDPAMVFKDGIGYSPERLRASVKGKLGWH